MIQYPLVSIIIPVHNAEKYIAETLSSALAQTWSNKEIIIVNDGSIDNSIIIAAKFSDPRIKIFNQANKGASAARNKGLSEAKGDYIQFLDADDVLSPNKIEEQVKLLQGKPLAISNCATVYFNDQTNPFMQQPVHRWYRNGSVNNVEFLIKLYGGPLIGPYGGMITNHAWLCPKEVINMAGKWNEELTVDDDGEFFCRVVLASREIVYSDTAACYYRKYTKGTSLSSTDNYDAAKSMLKAADLKADYLLSKTTDQNAKLALSRIYGEYAVSFYPKYRDLSETAFKKAQKLKPDVKLSPYSDGWKYIFAKAFGWKVLKYIQYLKHRF